jgi:hypothetical protein
MSDPKWIMLNNTTVPISSIESIVMNGEEGEYYFTVQCTNQKVYMVHFESNGGKWLYMICQDGWEEAKRGGERYTLL